VGYWNILTFWYSSISEQLNPTYTKQINIRSFRRSQNKKIDEREATSTCATSVVLHQIPTKLLKQSVSKISEIGNHLLITYQKSIMVQQQ
jgi:hypothetical protein